MTATPTPRPIVLLADSQLLFWKEDGKSFLRRAIGPRSVSRQRAAYLGACNGDAVEFYEIFAGAMDLAGIVDHRMIPSQPTSADTHYLEDADVIVLGGGDPALGWRAMRDAGLVEVLQRRQLAGASLVGVSAGAMLLGLGAWRRGARGIEGKFRAAALAPFVISAHEDNGWPELREAIQESEQGTTGIGLPLGGGALYHADGTLEPIRMPVYEIWKDAADESLRDSLLMPGVTSAPVTLTPTEIIVPRRIR